jgi:tRNA-specific 2-thiouridylase
MKIAVGLSGGVDSSVALALLQREGHEVFGVTMKIWDLSYRFTGGKRHACLCPGEDEEIEIAKQVCDILKVPHYVVDCSKEYKEKVLDYFVSEYVNGRTPNPCVVCNAKIKFGSLLDIAKKIITFDKFATGHYAIVYRDDFIGKQGTKRHCVEQNPTNKDQSYFLCRLNQEQLSRCVLPLGHLAKGEVRELARKFKLPTSEIKDSQNFYSGDYRELIGKDAQGGAFISFETNEVVGRHKGYWNYTIGQRIENERYVKEIQADKNIVVVSNDIDTVTKDEFSISDFNFVSCDSIIDSEKLFVKVRSSGTSHECYIDINRHVKLADKTIITPGQFAVFYDENGRLIFSSVIKE